jgi:tetratricopeptide (TPR) repeat protein
MYRILIIAITLIILNCSDHKNTDVLIPIGSSNPEAISFFRKAEINRASYESIEAKENYLSAIKLDSNFILAHNNIISVLGDYNQVKYHRKKVSELIINSNDFEKLFIKWYNLPSSGSQNYNERLKIADKIIELYPNSSESYYIYARSSAENSSSTARANAITALEKSLSINKNNVLAYELLLALKFAGQSNAYKLKNDLKFYEEFEKFSRELDKEFPNSRLISSRIANVYRNSYNYSDQSRYEIAEAKFKALMTILDEVNSSSKGLMMTRFSLLYTTTGDLEKSLDIIDKSIKITKNEVDLIERNFFKIRTLIYFAKYLEAINLLNDFENQILSSEIDKNLSLKSLIGIYNFKAIIFAHANRSEEAFDSFKVFKSFSSQLLSLNNIDSNNSEQISEFISNNQILSQAQTRWSRLTRYHQDQDEIWINILVGKHDKAYDLINKFNSNYNVDLLPFKGILSIMKGDVSQGYEILKDINNVYFRYFLAQAMINLGMKDEARDVLDIIRKYPFVLFDSSFVIKGASDLYNSL